LTLKQQETKIEKSQLLIRDKNIYLRLLDFFQKKLKRLDEVKKKIIYHKENASNKQDLEELD
jgi:hypothetical protein